MGRQCSFHLGKVGILSQLGPGIRTQGCENSKATSPIKILYQFGEKVYFKFNYIAIGAKKH